MFNLKNITAAILCCGLLGACARPAADTDGLTPPVSPDNSDSRVTLLTAEDDISVYVFKSDNDDYVFSGSIHDGWTMSGESFTQEYELDLGNYKFLFAKGYGNNLLLDPQSPNSNTKYDDLKFLLQQQGGKYVSCDQLFLAEKEWKSATDPRRIEVTLQRAVSRIDLNLRRGIYTPGYSAESDYEPVPYENGETILDYIDRIELTATGVGNELVPFGQYSGSVTLVYDVDASQYTTINNDGFTQYEGPYFIPTDNQFKLDIKLIPVAGKNIPQLSQSFDGLELLRNEKLTVNLWLNQLYLTIGVTAETSPIEDHIEGDSGIWD